MHVPFITLADLYKRDHLLHFIYDILISLKLPCLYSGIQLMSGIQHPIAFIL